MVGELQQPAGSVRRARALEPLADAQVQLGTTQGGHAVVDRAPHELVAEAVDERPRRHLLDHAVRDGLGERRVELPALQPGGRDDGEVELAPGDGRLLEQAGRRGAQAGEPLADHLADALGAAEPGERAREPTAVAGEHRGLQLEQRPPQLRHKERVAAGELPQRAAEVRQLRAEIGAGGARHELGDLRRAQAAEPQADDALGAPQVRERRGQGLRDVRLRVAERRHQHGTRLADPAGEVAQEQERRRVGPVGVLHDEHDGRAAADGGQQIGQRAVQAVALRVGVGRHGRRQLPDPEGQVGHEPRKLPAAGTEIGPQRLGVRGAHELVERLDERPVRTPDDRVAGAVEDERAALCGLVRELPHEAALPGARLARHEHEARRVAVLAWQQRAQHRELARAAGEREGRREAERTGEPGHSQV